MSTYGERPRGGQEGIIPDDNEIEEIINKLAIIVTKDYIRLPYIQEVEQVKRMYECEDHSNAEYWEYDSGQHGWCCSNCGYIVQYG